MSNKRIKMSETSKEEEANEGATSDERDGLEVEDNLETESSAFGTAAPLSVKNMWQNRDIASLILKQIPPENLTFSWLKSIRFMSRAFNEAATNLWRNTAVLRICSHVAYTNYQSNPSANRQKAVSVIALLAKIAENEAENLKEEVAYRNLNVLTVTPFPLESDQPQELKFWEKFGPRIKYLRLNYSVFDQAYATNGFRCLLEQCPDLEELILQGRLELKENFRIRREDAVNDKPVFLQTTRFKALTIEHHEIGYGQSHWKEVQSIEDLLVLTPRLQSLKVSCELCSELLSEALHSLAEKGVSIKLERLKVRLADNLQFREIFDYIEIAAPSFKEVDFKLNIDNFMYIPINILKASKKTMKTLNLEIIASHHEPITGHMVDRPRLVDFRDRTFGALELINLKLNSWRNNSIGSMEGCRFPMLTRLFINCTDYQGMWFNILNRSSFPSLIDLQLVFDGYIDMFNSFDFSGFEEMSKLEKFVFKAKNRTECGAFSRFVTSYPICPFKLFNESFVLPHLEDVIEPEYESIRLEQLTEFCYPAIFTATSLNLIRNWLPKLKILEIGADCKTYPIIFRLFHNLDKITLFIRLTINENIIRENQGEFQGTLDIVRVVGN